MTRKNAKPDFDTVTEAQTKAIESLKQRLTSSPILAPPKHDRPYVLDCDASAYPLGCTLLQEQTDRTYHPVGCWSYSLNDTEKNYSATEWNCYSVVWTITTLRLYIEETRFTVRQDHDALRWLMSLKESSGHLMQWRLRLAKFDFVIDYRADRVHKVPYGLLRLLSPYLNSHTVKDDLSSFGNP